MIFLILKSFYPFLLIIGAAGLCFFIFGVYTLTKVIKYPQKGTSEPVISHKPRLNKPIAEKIKTPEQPQLTLSHAEMMTDVTAIAGEDLLATQLDLARAYIEMGKQQGAKKLLEQVIKRGNAHEQQEAKRLLTFI